MKISMKSCKIVVDDVGGFDFIEDKGWFSGAAIETDSLRYDFIFYDLERLKQEVEDRLLSSTFFFEENLLIVERVRRDVIIRSLEELIVRGDFSNFISKPIRRP